MFLELNLGTVCSQSVCICHVSQFGTLSMATKLIFKLTWFNKIIFWTDYFRGMKSCSSELTNISHWAKKLLLFKDLPWCIKVWLQERQLLCLLPTSFRYWLYHLMIKCLFSFLIYKKLEFKVPLADFFFLFLFFWSANMTV